MNRTPLGAGGLTGATGCAPLKGREISKIDSHMFELPHHLTHPRMGGVLYNRVRKYEAWRPVSPLGRQHTSIPIPNLP